jgi:hypothetical protein
VLVVGTDPSQRREYTMSNATAALMVAVVAVSALGLGAAFGYEGGFGLVVGGASFWFSPGMSIIGGFAGFGAFLAVWIVAQEFGLID